MHQSPIGKHILPPLLTEALISMSSGKVTAINNEPWHEIYNNVAYCHV